MKRLVGWTRCGFRKTSSVSGDKVGQDGREAAFQALAPSENEYVLDNTNSSLPRFIPYPLQHFKLSVPNDHASSLRRWRQHRCALQGRSPRRPRSVISTWPDTRLVAETRKYQRSVVVRKTLISRWPHASLQLGKSRGHGWNSVQRFKVDLSISATAWKEASAHMQAPRKLGVPRVLPGHNTQNPVPRRPSDYSKRDHVENSLSLARE